MEEFLQETTTLQLSHLTIQMQMKSSAWQHRQQTLQAFKNLPIACFLISTITLLSPSQIPVLGRSSMRRPDSMNVVLNSYIWGRKTARSQQLHWQWGPMRMFLVFNQPATRNCLGVQPLEFVLCPGTYGAGNEHINEIFEVLCADSDVHFAVSLWFCLNRPWLPIDTS